MSKPIRRARDCGTYQPTDRSDKSQADKPNDSDSGAGRVCDAALQTLAAVTVALQAGATPKLFSAATRREPFRLNTIDDVAEAYASGVPLTGDEVVRAFWILRDEMKARGLPLDWYSRTRRDDESLQ